MSVTIFSAPKPFEGHIDTIQRNAIASWGKLGDRVEVLLIGDEPGLKQAAAEFGVRVLPDMERNETGTPLVSSIFDLARRAARFPALAYLNTDIILVDDLQNVIERVSSRFDRYLMIGRRWDLDVPDPIDFSSGWQARLWREVEAKGRLHPAAGSDYFGFPKQLFADLPRFALGRAGWDNWMIYAGRRMGVPVVDVTAGIRAIHQNHDYAHLEGGVPHYRQPESLENIRLAGGPQTIFTLADATWRMRNGKLIRAGLPGGSITRALEAGLTTRLGHGRFLQALRVVLHPLEYLRSLKNRNNDRIQHPSDARGG